MSIGFKDYYATLGVPKNASQDEIKKAFRDLARKYHPDLAAAGRKAAHEERFKEVNEAYEVLKDPEKRKKYDQLGANWDKYEAEPFARQNAASAAGFGHGFPRARSHPGQGFEYRFRGTGFSDFFERFFGSFGSDPFDNYEQAHVGAPYGSRRSQARQGRGSDVEAELLVTLEEALNGAQRRISLKKVDPTSGIEKEHTIDVRIPAGVREGQRIRLAGQGQPSSSDGQPGDLFLKTRFAQHPFFAVKDSDLHCILPVAPWEAALGAVVDIPTLRGHARVTLKPGSQDGQKLRLPKQGLPHPHDGQGDLIAEIRIKMPKTFSQKETELWKQLRDHSNFKPRTA